VNHLEDFLTKKASPTPTASSELIPLERIFPDPHQPRKSFDDEALQDLSQSLKQHGLLNPILVKPINKGYQIIAGERRWRAAKLIPLKEIPCSVLQTSNDTVCQEIALIENIQRESLNPMEEAEALFELAQHYTHQELAERIGKKRSTLSNTLRLLELPPSLQKAVRENRLQVGHVKVLLSLDSEEQMLQWGQLTEKNLWSVRELEKKLKHKKPSSKTKSNQSSSPLSNQDPSTKITAEERERISEELKGLYGTQVIITGYTQGTIELRFYSQDDLVRLTNKLTKSL
jgi:ParB family chromosome partitioning protein